jgi:hypothetical protein
MVVEARAERDDALAKLDEAKRMIAHLVGELNRRPAEARR